MNAKERIFAEAPSWTDEQADAALRAARGTAALDLTILYEDGDDDVVIASVPAISGVFSQGRDRDEARANVLDALALMLAPEPGEHREQELLHLTVT